MLVVATALFTACDNDDNPITGIQLYSEGAFIVNSGNMTNKIDGSLTFVDYKTNKATQKVFQTANGVSLGNTPNDGLVYGNKIYVAVDQENTVEVLDKTTFKRLKQIKTTELLGTTEGKSPRHVVADNGKVYVSTFGGVVAAIDTVDFKLAAKYKVGNYPEGMLVVSGNSLFVANSNYGKGGGNISVINLDNGSVTTKDVKGVNNPQGFYIGNDRRLYVLDWATYDPNTWAALTENNLRRLNTDLSTSEKVADANYVAVFKGVFMIINAPYGKEATYSIYSPTENATKSWDLTDKVEFPCGAKIDPVRGNVFIMSYHKSQDGNGPDYNADGYVNLYKISGTKTATYNVGVGPVAVFFNAGFRVVTE
ncbi:hypothetical protein C3V39_12280 [Prevotella sp. oral taxon 820]|nr:hypothetical protein C3V39_12280 [Prevotella sp. oral taxon 820]